MRDTNPMLVQYIHDLEITLSFQLVLHTSIILYTYHHNTTSPHHHLTASPASTDKSRPVSAPTTSAPS